MKKTISLFAAVMFFSPVTFAEIALEPLLNKVTLSLEAEQWVTTKTALVSVGINAAVSDRGIERIQNDVMEKLKQFSAAGDWHIISYNRQQDKSGLESIQMTAQARLPQAELAGLRDKAKALSKPGETYTIDNVQFDPSEEELKEGNIALRNNIYQQAKTELDTLNKAYPDQKFYLHQIDFLNNYSPPVPMMAKAEYSMAVGAPAAAPARPLSVGNKQQLRAVVILAAMPDVVTQRVQSAAR